MIIKDDEYFNSLYIRWCNDAPGNQKPLEKLSIVDLIKFRRSFVSSTVRETINLELRNRTITDEIKLELLLIFGRKCDSINDLIEVQP